MNPTPVTVIVPVFNEMATLSECLDSLKTQNYPVHIEIIVVDDGSTDGSGEYARSRGIKVIRQENRGPGPARNAGASVASGDLLVFTDADCVPDPDFVRELVKPLEDPGISGSMGVFYSTQQSLTARFIQNEASERYRMEDRTVYIDWVATYGACYRRDVFLASGGFSDIYKKPSSEDAELSFRLAKDGHKMVLAPKARVKHIHPEKFREFLKYKFNRAYWTVWLYRKYPRRLARDRMTPPSRKGMMALMAGAVALLIAGIWWRPALWTGIAAAVMLMIWTLPFSARVMKKDPALALVAPAFLLARTACYIAGFGKGMLDYWRKKHSLT